MDNAALAAALGEMGDLLEIEGANPFRVRAYRNAVHTLEALSSPISQQVAEGKDLTELPGIGTEMARHLTELVQTGQLGALAELSARVPRSLTELLRLPGLGPKKIHRLWQELGVTDLPSLEAVLTAGRVANLDGFGAKSAEKLRQGLTDLRQHQSRFPLGELDRIAAALLTYLRGEGAVDRLEAAGSFRRRKDTVGDLDVLATSTAPERVMARFLAYPEVARVEMSGPTRSSVVLKSGLQVDFRVVPERSFGAALVYFTGSKEHNIKLRQRALDRGLTLSEWGLFPDGEGTATLDAAEPVAGATEEEVYSTLGLPWVAPVLREDRGELTAADAGALPRLVTAADLRGDLHMHTTWSDGKATLEEMVAACVAKGYEYHAISDHSKALAMTGGLDAAALRRQWQEIDEVQRRYPGIRLLKSQEIDILADGSLDLEDEAIAGLDIVLIAVHSRLDLPAAEQTERILRAVAHPRVHLLVHPTGRLLGRRKPMEFDLDRVLRACADHGVAVEASSQPDRLDLKDVHLRRAKELGLQVAIDTDAHAVRQLDLAHYGVEQAQRAWLTPADVLNTKPLAELEAWLGRKRPSG